MRAAIPQRNAQTATAMNGKVSSWKLKRELARVVRQINTRFPMISTLLRSCSGPDLYDFLARRRLRRSTGNAPFTSGPVRFRRKVAIYLLSPDRGVEETHIASLEYLIAKGYAPVVVCGQPISDADRARLLGQSAIYIERTNIGDVLDGYREAVLSLRPLLPRLKRLVMLDDSRWLTVSEGCDWIEQAEALNKDFAAAASCYRFSDTETSDHRALRWTYGASETDLHYCSFALMISAKVLRASGFMEFWHRLQTETASAGALDGRETGLGQWVMRQGFSHGATYDMRDLDKELDRLSDARLRWIVDNLVLVAEPGLAGIRSAILDADRPDRADMMGLILTAVARQGSNDCLAHYALGERKFCFLRKSPVYLEEDASNATIRIACSLDGPNGEAILSEAVALRAARAAHFKPELRLDDHVRQDLSQPEVH